jgi:ribosomal protein L11 methyltransferase
MSWLELTLDTTHEAVDWVRTLLAENIDSNDIYITEYEQPNTPDSSWTFTIRLYLPNDINARTSLEKIENLLSPLYRTQMTTALQTAVVAEKTTHEPQALIHNIGEKFVVVNSHTSETAEITDKITLKLQNNLAFGSGLHPTTILTLRLLERHIEPKMNVLDLGSGSGILSVAMAKLGAEVLALDNDSVAVQATQKTVSLNAVDEQVKVIQGSLGSGSDLGHWMGGDISEDVSKIAAKDTFDLIVANIFARIHIALADEFRQALDNKTQPGLLITAGFTTDHEENVTTAMHKAGFEIIDCERFHEWVAFAYQCNS